MFVLIAALLLAEPSTQQPQELTLSKTESRMIDAINEYRAEHKLPPLTMDPILMKVARYRAPYFTHSYQGRWMWDEAKRFGFDGFATDDLAQGHDSPEDAVRGWAHSPIGHAEQMRGLFKMNGRWENRHFDKVGVARSGRNWIAIFGKSNKTEVVASKPSKKAEKAEKTEVTAAKPVTE